VAASGDLFVVDINKSRFEPLTQTSEAERIQASPTIAT